MVRGINVPSVMNNVLDVGLTNYPHFLVNAFKTLLLLAYSPVIALVVIAVIVS